MAKNIKIVALIILGVALIALSAAIVMWLWNWVAVGVFGLPVVDFWAAFGIMILCRLLFANTSTERKKG